MQQLQNAVKRREVRKLEELGRTRLSEHFFLRDFLHSEVAQVFGVLNAPDDPDLAIETGSRLCRELLEPLRSAFGDVRIRSGYRSSELNALGNRLRLGCAKNESNFAGHIWDQRDAAGRAGATATVVLPWLVDRVERGGDWRSMAWWIHDHLPYSYLCFYPKLTAFNIQWREEPERRIMSWVNPKGLLTASYMSNFQNDQSDFFSDFPRSGRVF